ncbi:MAG: hypothetical protein GXX91_12325 [Verrucomicrobiaceae bacterium]|nr:hypothetical protein [Verrucomicrobiaceae bacterium]
MDSRDSNSPESEEYAAALPLEISHEVASRADDLLREFAEDSGLETALIVDRSGALVAGISAEEEVTVEVISALVAGASGAMRALVSRLGETGALESLHLGGDRLVYLREIVNRFILVGVSEATRPAGLVRNKARHIEGELAGLLHDIRPAEVPLPAAVGTGLGSVREAARQRAARDLLDSEAKPEREQEQEQEIESGAESLSESEPELAPEDPVSSAKRPISEPRGILEPLDFGEPEIVIEPSVPLPAEREKVVAEREKIVPPDEDAVDFPFDGEKEVEGVGEEEESPPFLPPSGSVFELELEADDPEIEDEPEVEDDPEIEDAGEADDEPEAGDAATDEADVPASLPDFFQLQEEEEDNAARASEEAEAAEPLPPVFEFDAPAVVESESAAESAESDAEMPEAEEAFTDFLEDPGEEAEKGPDSADEAEDFAGEIKEMIDEEEEESEVRSSGPFYF